MLKFLFSLSLFFYLCFPQFALAHTLESEDSIGVVFHIDPQDSPVSGEHSKIFFEIKDKDNEFKPENCDCDLTIIKDNTTVLATKIYGPAGKIEPAYEYNFPTTGDYSLKIIGKPFPGKHFDDFEFNFNVQVSKQITPEAVLKSKNNLQKALWLHWGHFILFGGAFVIAFALYFRELYVAYIAKKKNQTSIAED